MSANGYISVKTEQRAFCTNCKKFLADAFIRGICPKCKEKDAKGNQCDACGSLLEAEELIEPYCNLCKKSKIEFKDTKHWFLDLDKLEPELKKYVESHPEWQANVKNMIDVFSKLLVKKHNLHILSLSIIRCFSRKYFPNRLFLIIPDRYYSMKLIILNRAATKACVQLSIQTE